MKTRIILFFALVISVNLKAQFNGAPGDLYYNTGNVGIGISTPPQVKIDLGSAHSNGLQFRYNDNPDYRIRLAPYWNSNTDTRLDFNIERMAGTGFTTAMSVGYANNVGIGTTSPDSKVTLQNSLTGLNSGIMFKDGIGNNRGAVYFNGAQDFVIDALSAPLGDVSTFKIRTGSLDRISIMKDGNVGIGIATPDVKLVIAGGLKQIGDITENNNAQFYNNSATGYGLYSQGGSGSRYAFSFVNKLGESILFGKGDGNVGIGTTIPDAKLAVLGDVHAKEVRVDLNVPGPDYVFENNYKLPSLKELSIYIKVNKHLPEVPSAYAMEDKGINLGEMNMLLLKKVEELTLYVIEQQKRIEKLEKQNSK